METINYLHRRVGDTDIYFLANRSPESHTFTGVFRATGVPVFWNAEDGTSANVLVYAQSDGRTRIPMKIEGFGSAYVVFSPGSDRPHVVRTDLPGITEVTVDSVTGLTPYTGTFYADVDIWGDVRRRTGDALDIPAVRPFWKAITGYVDEPGPSDLSDGLIDPAGRGPAIWFQQMDAPRHDRRNRIHLDLDVAHDAAADRLAAALAAGGRLLSDAAAPAYWVLADPEGNEVCICTWQGRD